MRARELSLKVREREPKTLGEAYRTAYQRMVDHDDRGKQPKRVKGAQETDVNAQNQSQLDRFLATQREEQGAGNGRWRVESTGNSESCGAIPQRTTDRGEILALRETNRKLPGGR